MNRIELKINDDKTQTVVTPQPLVEGENLTTDIAVTPPESWVGYDIRCLLTTPKGVLVDAVDASVPVPLTNTMLDGKGTLYVEYVAMKDGTEIARTKSPALLPVSAARSIIGDIDPAPLPDLVAEMVAAKGDCDDAAAAAVLATERIEATDADIKAAEEQRVQNENDRISSEAIKKGIRRIRSSIVAEALISTLKEAANSVVIVNIGDSLGDQITEWPALFAQKLGAEFPAYNVKYKLYGGDAPKYSAWQDLRTNGPERCVQTIIGRTPLCLRKTEVPITSPDLDVSFCVALDDWQKANQYIVARYGVAGERCWFINIDSSQRFNLAWTTDGTNLTYTMFDYAVKSTDLVDGQKYWYRFTLDVDDGAGHYVAKAYNSADGMTWNLIYTVTGASTTSIFNAPATPYSLGGIATATSAIGKYYEVIIRDGIGGRAANPQPVEKWGQAGADYAIGGATYGAPTIYVYNASVPGASSDYFSDLARLGYIIPGGIDHFVFVSLGHNETFAANKTYLDLMKALITGIKTYLEYPFLSIVTENPTFPPSSYFVPNKKRIQNQMAFAKQNSIEVINAYLEFLEDPRGLPALINTDGTHPNTLGEQLIADAVWNYVNILEL